MSSPKTFCKVPFMPARPAFDTVASSSFTPGRQRTRGSRVQDPYRTIGRRRRGKKLRMKTTEWVNHFVRVKDGNTGLEIPIAFDERGYLKRVYNTGHRKILLMTSRQTEKSTTLGNKIMAMSGMRPNYYSLFVTPSAMQTTVFSRTRIDDIVTISPLLAAQQHNSKTWNILEKEWANGSKIYLRYAFLNADRIRGLSVNSIFVDELQDVLQQVMPVIEETASRFENTFQLYSGTPKSFDNTIEKYWSGASTMSEWCIPCDRHGTPKDPGSWHWNVLGPKNLGLKGPICDRCGNPINPEHPLAQWVEMNPLSREPGDGGAEFEGYRVCRLMVPWFFKNPEKWREILEVHKRYPTAQFMNEVLALSFDSGVKPLSRMEMIRACDDAYDMDEAKVIEIRASTELFAGIDWGTGADGAAYTVLTVGGYCRGDGAFQVLYSKRFDGPLADPTNQMREIIRLLKLFRVELIGVDYGMGFHPNKKLSEVFGPRRVHQFQYAARSTSKVIYKAKLHRNIVFRTPVMADIFNAIKSVKIRFPSWRVYEKPFANDCLAIRSEYSDTMKMIKYDKPRGTTDDTFHSILYCMLASFYKFRRPDILAPLEDKGEQERVAREQEEYALEQMEAAMY
jgi:hypothetical protein